MLVVALALTAASFYGASDFCGGLATRRSPALAVVVWSQAVGLVVLVAALPIVPGILHLTDLGWGLACGVAGAFAVGLLYRGLAIGVMGVVSPITAVLAAALPVAFAIARGDRPPPLALTGIGLALVAVVLVSAVTPGVPDDEAPLARSEPPHRFPPGIPEAIGAGIAFGFFFIAIAQTHRDSGLYPLLGTRFTSLAVLAAGAVVLRKSLRVSRPGLRTIVIAGVLDMAANIFYVVAAHAGALSIVAVLTSLYPAGTVALAAIVLHERLLRIQWTGVAIAFAGVICISLAR